MNAIDPTHISRLVRLLGADRVLTRQEDLITYSFDGTPILNEMPGCIVFPDSVPQISDILKLADHHRMPIVTRGSGTGLSGGAIPVPGCIVLCMVRMDRILRIDPANLTALVEPGVITAKLDEAALPHGLFYPPDPGSMRISTIGGNVANNSGGLRGLKYGVTRDYVMALEVALPNGDILRTGTACVKDVAGYNLKDIFIGSEGTLGVITRVLLRLTPKPRAKKTLLATFASTSAAAETVSAIVAAHIIPCTLEFLDRTTIRCVEEYAKIGLPLDAEALLLMETDGHPAVVEEESAMMSGIAREHGAVEVTIAKSDEEAVRLAAARRTAFSALARVAPTTILEDATVPRSHLAEMINFIQQTAEKFKVRIGTFGHMGDGNLHPTFLTDERNHDEIHRVEQAFTEIFEKAVALEGTITGEHGVGLAKKKFLPMVIGPVGLEVHRRLKQVFDPNGIMNPGKMFDEQEGRDGAERK
ncbi:MAG: FAD-binding protein [Verrucomicrobia bacterium]|nr:FAD-binding protein [Verrucomicrobiota bacterium]